MISLTDLLSAISVLLVFLTFLFNGIEKSVNEILIIRKPENSQKVALKQFNNDILKLLFLKAIPVCVIFIITFYALVPRVYKILTSSTINFLNFNELETIFVFIVFGLLGLTLFAINKTIQLVSKLTEN